jgi:putative two-component system response regulator
MGITKLSDEQRILLVDDEATNLHILRSLLQDDYKLLFAKNGQRALELTRQEKPDLILLDVMMPDLTGFDVCKLLKADDATKHIPIIFVTALADEADETQGFELGCVDYISKPINPSIVRSRVKTHLQLVHMDELKQSRLQVVQRLGLAAEYKDNETGLHVIRMSHVSRLIAEAAGFSEKAQEEILHAAPMHDIGKIGIPDAILSKPGKLTPEEWEVMKTHPSIGGRIIGEDDTGLLAVARRIALYHHERWDGNGYPHGLKGEDIPVEARIIAIADVFDALINARPYKPAWPVDKAVAQINSESGTHFDPTLVECFNRVLPALIEVNEKWSEPEGAVPPRS